MTMQTIKTALLCCALAATVAGGVLISTDAEARGSKEFYSQDYKFDSAMHGFQGQQGSYYCSYQRLPNRLCDRNGNNCTITGWTLRQYCY